MRSCLILLLLASSARAEVNDLLDSTPPTPTDLRIFSYFDPESHDSTYNSNLWNNAGYMVDFRSVAWGSPGLGNPVAITRRHIICSTHAGFSVGQKYVWINEGGHPKQAYVVAVKNLPVVGVDETWALSSVQVGLLDRELPTYCACKLADPGTVSVIMGKTIIKLDNENKAIICRQYTTIDPLTRFAFQAQTSPSYCSFYYEDSVSGDSGSPVFAWDGGETVYLTHVTSVLVGAATTFGPRVPLYLDAINGAIDDMANENNGAGEGMYPTLHFFQ